MEISHFKKGQTIYFARILSKTRICDLLDLHIVTVTDDYITGCEEKTKCSFIFTQVDVDKIIFTDRNTALNVVKEAEKTIKKMEVSHTDCSQEDS